MSSFTSPDKTFAQKVMDLHTQLAQLSPESLLAHLPQFRLMNPFRENPEVLPLVKAFYERYFSDTKPRHMILGINPGRFGGGATGIPFTDSKRLAALGGFSLASVQSHEPSSVFVYAVIEALGGAEWFYRHYYINSLCPLGFLRQNARGNWVNANYYDERALFEAVRPFIWQNLETQITWGIDTRLCFVLGKKNAQYLEKLQKERPLFERVVVLEHPRFIQQYKVRHLDAYIQQYKTALQTGA
ncbi:MAG: SMUG2 DNA glycosylase family protein [Microscillaceae bacterium]